MDDYSYLSHLNVQDDEALLAQDLEEDLDRYAPVAIAVAKESGGIVARALAGSLRRRGTPALALRLAPLLTKPVPALSPAALVVHRLALSGERAARREREGRVVGSDREATLLQNYAGWLAVAGKPRHALAATRRAERIYRALADHPAFAAPYAQARVDLATLLLRIGRPEVAHAFAIDGAEDLYRVGAPAESLANADRTLADCLMSLGRHSEAVAPAKAALALYEASAPPPSSRFGPEIAALQNNLAVCAAVARDFVECAQRAARGWEQLRILTREDPQRHLGPFTQACATYASALRVSQDLQGARRVADETVADFRRYVREVETSSAFRADYAQALFLSSQYGWDCLVADAVATGLPLPGRQHELHVRADRAIALLRTVPGARSQLRNALRQRARQLKRAGFADEADALLVEAEDVDD